MDKRGDHMKTNFEYFQIQKWMPQTIRAEKVDGKNGVSWLVSIFPSRVMVLSLSKKVQYLQFCADLSKKSKYIKAIYIYATEMARCALSENGIVYYAMIYCFGDIRVWSQRTLLNICWVSIFFYILIANISWTVSQTPINIPFSETVWWELSDAYMEITSRDLDFLLRSAQYCMKYTFLVNLRTIV